MQPLAESWISKQGRPRTWFGFVIVAAFFLTSPSLAEQAPGSDTPPDRPLGDRALGDETNPNAADAQPTSLPLQPAIQSNSAADTNATKAGESNLTVGGTVFPTSVHPMLDLSSAKSWLQALIFRTLLGYDRAARMICMICTEVPTLANGRIRQVIRSDGSFGADVSFTLRDDAVWGDGHPITADDFAFGLEVGRNKAVGTATPNLYQEDIRGITINGKRSFTLHRTRPGCSLIALKDVQPLPAHLERALFDRDPTKYRHSSLYSTAPTTPGLWNGPYRLRSIEPGITATVERNLNWQGANPPLATITLRAFATTASLESAFLAGRVDALPGEIGLKVNQAQALTSRASGRYRLVIQPALVHEHLDVNHDNPALGDRVVRQALLMAIDRATLAHTLLSDQVILAQSDVPPSDPVYAMGTPTYPYDRIRAAALLDSVGWTVGLDGRRVNSKGEPLSIDLLTTAGHRERDLILKFITDSWEPLGITIRAASEPTKLLYTKTQPERRFHGAVLFSWRSPPAFPRRSTLHSDSIPSPKNSYSGQNYGGYRSAEMDRIIEEIEDSCGDRETELWAEYQRLYARDLPTIPLFFWADAAILPPWLTGAEPTGQQFPSTLWAEHWQIHPR